MTEHELCETCGRCIESCLIDNECDTITEIKSHIAETERERRLSRDLGKAQDIIAEMNAELVKLRPLAYTPKGFEWKDCLEQAEAEINELSEDNTKLREELEALQKTGPFPGTGSI